MHPLEPFCEKLFVYLVACSPVRKGCEDKALCVVSLFRYFDRSLLCWTSRPGLWRSKRVQLVKLVSSELHLCIVSPDRTSSI
jgi:hypothetical protein